MKLITKIQIVSVCFIVIFILIGICSFVPVFKREQNMTDESPAEILKVEPRYTRESDGTAVWDKIQAVFVAYRYKIGGQEFEKGELLPPNAFRNFKVGESAKVCFSPQNSANVKLFVSSHTCGK